MALMASASPSIASTFTAQSLEQMPASAFPAMYYWSQNATRGFGPFSSSYRYGSHPGYSRLTNSIKDLDTGRGFLVDHPSALFTLFSESEAHAIATCCSEWQQIRSLYRATPFKVSVAGGFGFADAAWDADVWYQVDNTVHRVQGYAGWNFSLYSGRACPDNHDLWAFRPGTTVEEYFCAVAAAQPDLELNLGDPSCGGAHANPSIGVGNPVHAATGNKFQREQVIPASGPAGLGLELFYNSLSSSVIPRAKWTHSYDRVLSDVLAVSLANIDELSLVPQSRYLSIRAKRPDGRILRFSNTIDWSTRRTSQYEWSGPQSIGERLYSVEDPETGEIAGLLLETGAGEREHYALNGRLLAIVRRDGQMLSLQYRPDGLLERVEDAFGNHLVFAYTSSVLTSVQAQDGAAYRISYDGSGNLSSLVLPDLTPADDADNPYRVYHYDDVRFPAYLTGITDERGNRVASWGYDDKGRVISSQHAVGSDSHLLAFNADGTTRVVDPKGRERIYRFEIQNGLIKVASITGGPCGKCNDDGAIYAYDTGGFLSEKTDFNGHLTTYVRDSRGRELSRTEAAGTPQARTIATTWHPEFNKPSVVSEPGRQTVYSYDAQGRLLSTTVQPQL